MPVTVSIPPLMMQELGDASLPYLSYEGHGSLVIFLHATGFLPWLWHPVTRDLSPAYRVIAPFIGDYRRADPEKGGLPWTAIAQDIVTFCKIKNIKTPFLIGHSMGATTLTIAHAHYGLDAKGMILIEPIFLPEDFYSFHFTVKDHPLAAKALKRANRWKNASDATDYLKSREFFRNWNEEVLELYIQYGMKEGADGELQLVCSPETEAALFMGGVHFNPWPILPNISCPVLAIEGETSDSKNFTNIKRAASMIPDASYTVIRNAGHLIPMEQPEMITAAIKTFLDQTP